MLRFALTVVFVAAAAFAPIDWMLGIGADPIEAQQSLARAPAAPSGVLVAGVHHEAVIPPTLAP